MDKRVVGESEMVNWVVVGILVEGGTSPATTCIKAETIADISLSLRASDSIIDDDEDDSSSDLIIIGA
ncbi:hypothetical protein COLO4_22375 [Corchorus olitorius]|uniref:Uncharacterized protein n=1 Tax=Corchorus olitorius TaxID=93759 RepID=A0A1R3IM99_9ROSI|nr:hypothetical protein COLO4_22375 [Corchorus olitorius]